LHFDVISIFPEMFGALTEHGVCARGLKLGAWSCTTWNPRDFTDDTYRRVDDRPYGGGPGMVMMPGPLQRCLDGILDRTPGQPVILLSPQGRTLNQRLVLEMMTMPRLCLLAGRYEAIDQRLVDRYVTMEISVGDFVVSGGELPAMMLMDALIRRLPGVVNDENSILQDSFEDGLLDCPHYTRPEVFEGLAVPPVLLSGHHMQIEKWRREQKLMQTWKRRPELIDEAMRAGRLLAPDQKFLSALGWRVKP
jgi:tRNA (guanine37-N1)-methyltransferase